MDAKSVFASKVFWFNVLSLVVVIANGFGFADFSADPMLGQYAAVIITVINVVLRLATKKPVKV